MRFFGDWNIVVRRADDRSVIHSVVYDRHSLALRELPVVRQKYPEPEFFVQIGTWTKYLPSLRGHPRENAVRVAQEQQAPEALALQAWSLDQQNARDIEHKVAFLWRKYLFVFCAALAWAGTLVFSIIEMMEPWKYYGLLSVACWVAVITFLFLHEREWGFSLFLALVLFIVELVVMLPIRSGWQAWIECKIFGTCG
jgi:hypothetical protein